MHGINAAERALLELIRNDSQTVNITIGYLRYSGKKEIENAVSDEWKADGQRLLIFADTLANARDGWRAGM